MKTDIRYDTIGRAAILSIAILLFTCLPTLATDYMNMEDMKLTIPTMEARLTPEVISNYHTNMAFVQDDLTFVGVPIFLAGFTECQEEASHLYPRRFVRGFILINRIQ